MSLEAGGPNASDALELVCLCAAMQQRKQADLGRRREPGSVKREKGNVGRTHTKERCIDIDESRHWLHSFDRRQLGEYLDCEMHASEMLTDGDEGDPHRVRPLRLM